MYVLMKNFSVCHSRIVIHASSAIFKTMSRGNYNCM